MAVLILCDYMQVQFHQNKEESVATLCICLDIGLAVTVLSLSVAAQIGVLGASRIVVFGLFTLL